MWSFSKSRLFRKCQRQWYYDNHVASAQAKDPLRREAYLLSKLDSISAWRGNLVDHVISTTIIPKLNYAPKRLPTLSEVLDVAKSLFNQQIEFAFKRRLREPEMTVKAAGNAFAAFYDLEYGGSIEEQELNQAWSDIELALTNLLKMSDLWQRLRKGSYLIAQRTLTFDCAGVKVQARPDLIVFYQNEPPVIVDWKVHSFGTSDYRLQLALYAAALISVNPHRDFPLGLNRYTAQDIKLFEVQLLTNQIREYAVSETDVEIVVSHVVRSNIEMNFAMQPINGRPVRVADFPATSYAEECQRCPFRSLCWVE